MQRIQKAIIPIAGYGTRLFPATKAVPKALFPIIAQDGIAKLSNYRSDHSVDY
jgi:UTP--glucose-1-phosphate uridylyltransferase